ncbi:hypothetical protein [Roseivirga sp.]|uniref:hypothetical protein n=1 Tax=Roseivirga sp. TaxID=1964215 RepID=UPI003B8D8B0E
MKNSRIQKALFSVFAIAFLVVNGMFIFPQKANAFELPKDDCYYTWDLTGFTEKSFIKCDGCTRIEAYAPTDKRKCTPIPE